MIRFSVQSNEVETSVSEDNPEYEVDAPVLNYNLLNGKPKINGVELAGNKTTDELGLVTALIGTDAEITPTEAAEALAAGREVIITTYRTFLGESVTFTLSLGMIVEGIVGASQVFAPAFAMGGVYNVALIGFTETDSWAWNVEALAREADLPTAEERAAWSGKQNALTAGDNIGIDEDNVISVAGTVPQAAKAALTGAIPFGQVDDTSTSTVFTATVPGITEMKNGVCVMLKNGVVSSAAGFTVNINGLGAYPVYSSLAAATAATTLFNVNYTLLLVFDEDRISGGCWVAYYGYDSNTNTIGYQIRTNSSTRPASDKFYRYRLLFSSADMTKWVPANTSSSTNATAARTPCTTPINPWGPIVYYGTTTAISAGSSPSASQLWQEYTLSLGYSFNTTGAALTLTNPGPVFLKCTPQSDGSALMDEIVQALPTTNDGKIYIYLGDAYSATNIELRLEHPVYYHDGTRIRLWT